MQARKQKMTEKVQAYFFDKLKMCRDLKLEFREIKEHILCGLKDRKIVSALLAKQHVDSEELLQDIFEFQRILNSIDNEQIPREIQNVSNASNKTVENATRNIFIRDKDKPPRCYNCNKFGHLSKNCRIPKTAEPVCYGCRKQGHIARNCPDKICHENRQQRITVLESNNMRKTTIEKYIQNVCINNLYNCIGMVDAGSAVCTIKEDVVRKIKLPVVLNKKVLYGFGDKSKVDCHALANVTIAIDGVSAENIELVVVPDDAQLVDVIVGRTFTELPNIAYVRVHDKLKFGYIDAEPFCNFELGENIPPKTKIIVQNDTILENGVINYVAVKVDQQEIAVPVLNSKDSKFCLKMNTCIGKITDARNMKQENEEIIHRNEIKREQVKVDNSLSEEELDKLMMLLNKYREAFALTSSEIGCTNLIKMDIKDNDIPVRRKPYRASAQEREKIAEIVGEWKRHGIVTETTSPYASPVLLVTKKSGEARLVVDYRQLNNQTVKLNFPIPTIDEHFESLTGCTIFSILDLAQGYLQVPLTEEAKKKTAFITPDETGQFERMIFGLTNAPFEFCRLMALVLGPLKNKVATCYLDDILVPARNWSDMLNRLELVFKALSEAGLTMKLEKCEFGKREVEYLGFQLSEEGLKPGARKIQAIKDFPKPTNIHEIRRFLGLTSFFRRFIKNYARRAKLLSDLTRKENSFQWEITQEDSFEYLKDALTQEPILALYDDKKQTQLHTDASSVGIAAMLLQQHADKRWHLVYCVSKKTTDAESRYHSSKLELLAIVWSVERLRHFLLGVNFEIITDCQAIVFLNTKKTVDPQISRWFNLLSEYKFEIKHRAGKDMQHVDALSRAPMEEANETIDELYDKLNVMMITEDDRVLFIQRADEKLKNLIKILEKSEVKRTKEEKSLSQHYELDNGRLYRIISAENEERRLYVIPNSMRKSLVVKYHDLSGHFSVDRTVAAIKQFYWFSGMRRYIRRHINGCLECLLIKVPAGKQPGKLHPIPPPKRPFERVHADHLGPFIRSKKGNIHLLVIVDALTKFVRLFPMSSTKSGGVIKVLDEFINQFGVPKVLVTDRGTSFTSSRFKQFCEEKGIHHTLNSSRHPQANGQVERVNRTVIPVIMTKMTEENDWDSKIKEIERDLNNAESHTTRKTPFECLYGFIPSFHDSLLRRFTESEQIKWTPQLKIHEEIRQNMTKEQERYKNQYDKRRYLGLKFNIGDIVVMKKAPDPTGYPTKTQLKYTGPLIIEEILPSDTYRVCSLKGIYGRGRKHNYKTTAHVSQIKIYRNAVEDDESDQSDEDTDHTSTEEFKKVEETNKNEEQVDTQEYEFDAVENEADDEESIEDEEIDEEENKEVYHEDQARSLLGNSDDEKFLGRKKSQRVRKKPKYLQDYM